MPKDIEIEIKVRVKDVFSLLEYLQQHATHKADERQIDEYFVPSHRDFTKESPVNEWLRLRTSEGKYSINFKNWHRDADGKTNYCDEYESEVSEIDAIRKIFAALDIRPIVTVDKKRQIWSWNDYEISIDTVVGLRDFVEVEYKGKNEKSDPEKVTQTMLKWLESTGCEVLSRDYRGYPYMLLFPRGTKG